MSDPIATAFASVVASIRTLGKWVLLKILSPVAYAIAARFATRKETPDEEPKRPFLDWWDEWRKKRRERRS